MPSLDTEYDKNETISVKSLHVTVQNELHIAELTIMMCRKCLNIRYN